MKRYVDGYVLPVAKRNLTAYKKLAALAGRVWVKHGALEYVECIGDESRGSTMYGCLPFNKLTRIKRGETVVFAYIVFKSRAHRDRVHAKVHKDQALARTMAKYKSLPFDFKRMAMSGFETIVNKKAQTR